MDGGKGCRHRIVSGSSLMRKSTFLSPVLNIINPALFPCRCSLQHECTNFTGANFWASTSEGVQQCPSMTILEPEINIDKENPVRLM